MTYILVDGNVLDMQTPYDFSKRLLGSGSDSEQLAKEHRVVGGGECPRKVRIETQIHRRRAAKALSHLTLEWERAQSLSPDQEPL